MAGGSQQETPELGFVLLNTRQQGGPTIFKELMLTDRFGPVTLNFTVRDVATELSRPRVTPRKKE